MGKAEATRLRDEEIYLLVPLAYSHTNTCRFVSRTIPQTASVLVVGWILQEYYTQTQLK